MDFQLDSRLSSDCTVLGELPSGELLLLHNNAAVVWFIIVPKTDKTELFELPPEVQSALLEQVNLLSAHLKEQHHCDKINIAAIGNIVSQLHIHIIGRFKEDPYWPGVVWGQPTTKSWSEAELQNLTGKLQAKQIISG
ncbi:MAG: HIT family protein [Gammaproteobacteria bacterium]|nr:HIT family protein [Gammaproteobacteria bacterium]